MTTPAQHEAPDDAATIALFKARMSSLGYQSRVSGAHIEFFERGWAKAMLMSSEVAHWFTRSGERTSSLCGRNSMRSLMHGPGNFPRCQTCIKRMSSAIKRGASV